MNDEHKKIYAGMSEHEHQMELFQWAAVAELYGLIPAFLWAKTHPQFRNRPNGPKWFAEKGYGRGSEPLGSLRWLHAIPNGGSRGSNASDRAREGARMKAEGVKPGVADIFLPVASAGFHGLYIELKAMRGSLSADQKEFVQYALNGGYAVCVARGYMEAVKAIVGYLTGVTIED